MPDSSPAGYEHTARRDGAHHLRYGTPLADARGIGVWSDDHEVVVHDQASIDEIAAVDIALLCGWRMNQHSIGVARGGHPEGGASADRDDLDANPAFRLEARDQHVQQAAVLGTGRRCEDDRAIRLCVARSNGADDNGNDDGEAKDREAEVHFGIRQSMLTHSLALHKVQTQPSSS